MVRQRALETSVRVYMKVCVSVCACAHVSKWYIIIKELVGFDFHKENKKDYGFECFSLKKWIGS